MQEFKIVITVFLALIVTTLYAKVVRKSDDKVAVIVSLVMSTIEIAAIAAIVAIWI